MLVEGGIIAIAAVVVYVVYNSVYGRIIQESPPDIVNTFSLAVATVLIVSYVAFRWGDVLWKAKGRWLGWPFKVAATTVLAGLILIAVTYPYPVDSERPQEDDGWEIDVKRNTVYLASATIIALATFGSLVTIRVLGNPKILKPKAPNPKILKPKASKLRNRGFVLISGGIGSVIISQSGLMYFACCGSMNGLLFSSFFLLTVAALLFVTVGFAMIRDSESTNEEDLSSTHL